MSLLDMSFAGGALILAVLLLRAFMLDRLPKGAFLALWAVAALRLLLPFSIPSPASVYTLAGQLPPLPAQWTPPAAEPAAPALPAARLPRGAAYAPTDGGRAVEVWTWIWLAGALACGTFFLVSYLRCRREFRTALPVEDQRTLRWLDARKLRRTVLLRQSDRVDAPLTYGLLRPVILLPKALDGAAVDRLACVLEHELVHIQWLDALWKPLLAAAACVHWFNPLAWVLLVMANRDMELRCDETVVRRLGLDRRGEYARALLSMEERRRGPYPFASAFSRNAMEERIRSIMKMKKLSLAAILAAAVLVCCVGVGFATSAAEKDRDLRKDLTALPGENYTQEESQQLFSLWFDGYEEMTVADYRAKTRLERGGGALMELIERFSLDETTCQLPAGRAADALAAFNDYFFYIYEPLTSDQWRTREFDGVGDGGAKYRYSLTVLDADGLKVGDYERIRREVDAALRRPMEDISDAFAVEELSTRALRVEVGAYAVSFHPHGPEEDDGDGLSYSAAGWDRLLSPYAPFGLTYQFNDPDHDGNGLTMWFQGKEVRGIFDAREGVWITEHMGDGFSEGALELYTVYTDGVLSGLRAATPEEQAQFDASRAQAAREREGLERQDPGPDGEPREFPQASQEDYEALLALRGSNYAASVPYRDYKDLSLEDFNQRLLDWANAHQDAWDRINCDVIWNDYGAELEPEEKRFAALTCRLSGTENGAMIRALHTGGPEQDPGWARNLPERSIVENGLHLAWCNLYYDLSYHVADKSAVTVAERDACVGGMMDAIDAFWRDTDLEALLQMTRREAASRLNALAAEHSRSNIQIQSVTDSSIHFESYDERRAN